MNNSEKIRAAFRADGGPHIGMGHVMRCLALAKAMQEKLEILFIIQENKEVREIITKNGYKTVEISKTTLVQEVKSVKDILRKYDINIVVTDSYAIDCAYLEHIGSSVDLMVSIDDLNHIVFSSDLVINGNIYAPDLDYSSSKIDTDFLLGTEYVLMREEFEGSGVRTIREEVKRVLVSVGGSDPLNLTPKILLALGEIQSYLDVNVTIGPGFQNLRVIEEEADRMDKPVNLLPNAGNMAELMKTCDMAVTAGGTTLYELACTGTPAVVLLQADNQIAAASKMAEQGTVFNLGMGDKVPVSQLTSVISELICDWERRREMSQRGQSLVDGLGCRRCSSKILYKFHNKKGVGF